MLLKDWLKNWIVNNLKKYWFRYSSITSTLLIKTKKLLVSAGLDMKNIKSHWHMPTHVTLKTHVQYITCLKNCMLSFFIYLCLIRFLHSSLEFFLLPSLYILPVYFQHFFFLIVTFSFSCTCYLLNKLKQS